VSVVVHAGLIAAAVAATAAADPAPPRDPDANVIYYMPPVSTPQRGPARGDPGLARTSPSDPLPRLPLPDGLEDGIPVPTPSEIETAPIVFGGGDPTPSGGTTAARGGGGGEPGLYFEYDVDEAARALAGNPVPEYPRALRNANVEGTVLVQFVIDTTGRADLHSFRAITSPHTLFADAVRDAVARMRFQPARVGERPVRVLVQQRFAFRLAR
jgi:protein TonB